MAGSLVVIVPDVVADVLRRLNEALSVNVILAGGWAVHVSLVLAGRSARPTEDIDVTLRQEMRPARSSLAAIDALQNDPTHAARLTGLPLVVDLLADDSEEAMKVEPGIVRDDDGLKLMVPPFADLFANRARLVTLESKSCATSVLLPSPGALFASKTGWSISRVQDS